MKRWNRILAALLAATMLCVALAAPVAAEPELAMEDDGSVRALNGEGLDAVIGEDALEPLPDGVALELDEDLTLPDAVAPDEALEAKGQADSESNDSADFQIRDGVLEKYNGEGGDVVIPDGVTRIGKEAFRGCIGLTSVTIPGSVADIENDAFDYCIGLRRVKLSNGVKRIGERAFKRCASLTSVTIPGSVNSIGVLAFGDCAKLKKINVSRGNRYFASRNGVLYDREMKTLLQCPGAKKSVTIPGGITRIGAGAFADCNNLTSVVIPNGVTSIEGSAFSECEGLRSVTIPNSVTSIGAWAFFDCVSLVRVTIPKRVISIGEHTFWFCASLRSVTISNGVASIGEYAFQWCNSLRSVTIPESVTSIGRGAFCNCRDMVDATILSKNITFGTSVFNENIALRIVSGSNAVAWAEANGYRYDICDISDTALTLKIGQTHKLIAYGYKNSQLTWSSSNKKVATVSSGKVKAVGEGKCVISAKVKGGKTLKCKVTVTDSKLSKTRLTLSAVDSATVRLTGASGKKVTWSSSKAGVAKITKSSSGSATIAGVKPGTAVITAKIAGGKTLKCAVKVVAPLKMTTVKLINESDKRMLYAKFSNQSGKKITYIKCDILQYDSRNQQLKSPYDSFDLTATINAHASTTKRVDVNGETDHVKYRIIEVRFSDGTTWRP